MQTQLMNNSSKKEHQEGYAPSIHIRPEMTTPELHEAIELYKAEKRLQGIILNTKPAVVVHILKEKFSLL